MAGRSYTMKEMKQIVDYLVEHRLYSEIAGRKMWMDFANSKILNRTWQSMKETFIKRILPDIHNPYYKLTVEQISSFRQRYDIGKKNANRLEICTLSDESRTSDTQQAHTENRKQESTGEDKYSKIQSHTRSSTDTLVLENVSRTPEECYKTAEELRQVLESPKEKPNAQKSLRDFITYSEPLTPMLQEVLHDFSSDDERPMQIVEEPESNNTAKNSPSPITIRESQSYNKITENISSKEESNQSTSKIKSLKLKKTQKGTWENKEPAIDVSSTIDTPSAEDIILIENSDETEPPKKRTENSANGQNVDITATNDTPLPNNQEEFTDKSKSTRTSIESSNSEVLELHKKKKEKIRKRSRSQSSIERKKRKKDKHRDVSGTRQNIDTETYNSHPNAMETSKDQENKVASSGHDGITRLTDLTDDTNIPPNVVVEDTTEAGHASVNSVDINPCLQSVSLYEEQFSQTKYSGSEEETPKDCDKQNKSANKEKHQIKLHVQKNAVSTEKENVGIPVQTEKQNAADAEKQTAIDAEKQNADAEKQKVVETGKQKVVETEKQKVVETAKQKDVETEKQKVVETAKLMDVETEKQKVVETKKQKAVETGKQKVVETEKQKNHDNRKSENEDNQKVTDKSKEANLSNESSDVSAVFIRRFDHSEPSTSRNFNDVILLGSHSDSSTDFVRPKKRNSLSLANKSRERAIAHVFGFAGPVLRRSTINKSDSRQLLQRSKLSSINRSFNINSESDSSDDYTTASDSEDIPQSRCHNGFFRKHKKSLSNNIISHDNKLFVVGRKKIYPLMLHENGMKRFAKNKDQGDSYWKAKYLEQKKKLAEEQIRADELSRLLQEAKKKLDAREWIEVTQPDHCLRIASQTTAQINQVQTKPALVEQATNSEKVKIRFTKNKEIEFEGQWPNLNPLLEKMVEMFNHDDAQNAKALEAKSAQSKNSHAETKQINSNENSTIEGNKTIENEASDTVKKGEENKKIENEKPKDNQANSKLKNKKQANAPKRSVKGKDSLKISDAADGNKEPVEQVVLSSGKSTPSLVLTPADSETKTKVAEIENEIFEKIKAIDKTDQDVKDNEPNPTSDANVTKRTRGRPRKQVSAVTSPADTSRAERASSIASGSAKRARSVTRESPSKKQRRLSVGYLSHTESDKRASKPPKRYGSDHNLAKDPTRSQRSKSKASTRADNQRVQDSNDDDEIKYTFPSKNTRKNKRTYATNTSRLTSPDTSLQSESTQGYHESDNSPPNVTIRKKKKLNTANLVVKRGLIKKVKRKSCPYLADDDCSTNESQSQPTAANDNQTLSSEVYRSESYQILMPKDKLTSHLEKIEEVPSRNSSVISKSILDDMALNRNVEDEEFHKNTLENLSEPKGSDANSCMSLPLSPELSIVEPLYISKDLISSSLDEPQTINELQDNNEQLATNYDKYLISHVDVTMPLMGQQCDVRQRNNKTRNRRATFSESRELAQCSSDSLDQRLKALLLESAKKISGENAMEVDVEVSKNKTNKRRSSTPRKKLATRNLKVPGVGPVLEEHTENCSQSGRKSCPPSICIFPCEETVNTTSNANKTIPKRGRKKDVIKVKILRPRRNKSAETVTKLSVCTDSGINDTAESHCCDISTELIHNHSDTCLNDECVADSSVEIIENTGKSVISLDSTSLPSASLEISKNNQVITKEFDESSLEIYDTNARQATSLNSAKKLPRDEIDEPLSEYHTPPSRESFGSLITEDLSEGDIEKPSTGWHLISEEDSNFVDLRSQPSNSVGSNLHKIFTPCAVPDLSTISERSKENDTRTAFNTDTEQGFISQSIFEPDC